MLRACHRPSLQIVGLLISLLTCLGITTSIAGESDLSTAVTAPAEARLGQILPITVGYANSGPHTADSAYVNFYIPSGVPARFDELTQEQREAIQASTDDTDTLGNIARLIDEENFCEHLILQLQRDDDDDEANPVEGLAPGVSASFGLELDIPMEAPEFGRVTITEPISLAQTWRPALSREDRLEAGGRHLFGRGVCEKLVGTEQESTCAHIDDNCFGERVSLMDPVETEFELVNTGSTHPTEGCRPLIGFTPGNIAVIRRGSCGFFEKVGNAYLAGAVAAVIVNDGGCLNHPDSDQCVIDMFPNLGAVFTVPNVMLAEADGEPIIAALETGETVRGIIGPQEDDLVLDSLVYLADEDDLDPNPDNDQARVEINVIPELIAPPVASFAFSPEHPTVGSPIQFTDTSSFGPPTTWVWDFGDGVGTSGEQNPTYTYSASGSYTISLTVTNSAGTDTAEQILALCCGGPLSFRSFVPAAAFAAGADGAFFQTDLDLNNAGGALASYAFEWFPRGADNRLPLTSAIFTLGPGMGARYANVLSAVFGLEPNSVGALSIVSDSPFLLALSRTYNVGSDDGGTFGQALPAIPSGEMIPSGERRRIIFMTEDDRFRSNLGCQNGTEESLRIMIELLDDEGSSLESLHLDLPPLSNDQLNRVFTDHAPVNGVVDVWSTRHGASFTCYGSLLDNDTSDPTTIPAQ